MDTAHSILSSPFLAVLAILLGLAVLGLIVSGVVYMLRMGVQFTIQDLLVGTIMVGFPPAIGGMLAGARLPKDAYKIWVPAGSLSFLILIYLIYSFYWASIRPHPERKSQFWQRFAAPMLLALLGSISLWAGAPKLASQAMLDPEEEVPVDPALTPPTPANPNAPTTPLADPDDDPGPSAQPAPKPTPKPALKPTQPGPYQIKKKRVIPDVPAPSDPTPAPTPQAPQVEK